MGCINSKQTKVAPAEIANVSTYKKEVEEYQENVVCNSKDDHKISEKDGDSTSTSKDLNDKPLQSTKTVNTKLLTEDNEFEHDTSRSTLTLAEIHHIKDKSDYIASTKDVKREVATQTDASDIHQVNGFNPDTSSTSTQTENKETRNDEKEPDSFAEKSNDLDDEVKEDADEKSNLGIPSESKEETSSDNENNDIKGKESDSSAEKKSDVDDKVKENEDGNSDLIIPLESEKNRTCDNENYDDNAVKKKEAWLEDQDESEKNEKSETTLYNSDDTEEAEKWDEEKECTSLEIKSVLKQIDYEVVQGHPLKPPKLRKSQIIPDSSMFKKIEAYIDKTPPHATKSVPGLAKYICDATSDELEKVRAIHRWIVRNVSYDEAGKKSGNKYPCDAAAVLRNRCCVCAGYANLFKELCRECGVVAEVVSGFSKGKGWIEIVPHSLSDAIDHSWNAVFVKDDWRLVDCTWDSTTEGDFYFLTDPDHFLNTHFPFEKTEIVKSSQWQLMETPVDFDTFCASVEKYPHAYNHCVEPVTHHNAVIEVEKEVEICMRAIPNALDSFSANLRSMSGTEYENSVIVYKKEDNLYCIRIKPPLLMVYRLRIFGTRSSDKNVKVLQQMYDYIINCKSVHSNLIPYPKMNGVWGVEKSYSAYGFADGFPEEAFLKSEGGEIKVKFPVQENILPTCSFQLAHTDDEESADVYIYMERNEREILMTARLPKTGFYKLDVFAREPHLKTTTTELMASYLVECDTPLVPCLKYPKHYSAALNHQVSLKEPMTESLPSNTEIRFRLSSPLLKRVAINHTIEEKGEMDMFDLTIQTPDCAAEKLCIYGHTEMTGSSFEGLFQFSLI